MTEIDELYDKTIECPICRMEFSSKKVRLSKLRLIKRDKDFLSYYKGENPLKYSIFICPNCGYAATEGKFSSVTKEEKEIILKEISSKWNKRSYGNKRTVDEAILVYKLALYIGQLLDYKKIDLGTLCLRLAWLYRIKENKDEEKRFLTLTKGFFEDGFYKESLIGTNMDESKLGYLIGEINRRLSYKDESVKWFNTVLSNPNINNNPMLEKMVREQWRLAREG
ncbi:DUF2225 domain-containing protein [Clostridium sp. Cult2]|uniref:DUF2225 domain-containing protein n=1 Tax=Clostridium sp. Cult2 TaxID=2079003 RepID=UPI001F3C5177|nr:DUF2225 domain-containing protein [Clostridium sp. Cult2]MCF6466121.1 DUF2225 domain-containing protein [Clostridium sp. Cult2]